METYATTQQTIYHLRSIHKLLSRPESWCQGESRDETAFTLYEAFHAVGVDCAAYQEHVDENNVYPGDLNRGEIPETGWFVRQAMNAIAPEYGGLIHKWNDAPGRTLWEVLDLIKAALALAREELAQILSSDDGFDMSGVVLHRWADRSGSQVCAMSALSQKLEYRPLTDIPKEVDPGLAALVNLLNDRATDKARQLLTPRLRYLPNMGQTNVCALVAQVFFPKSIFEYGYRDEADAIAACDSRKALAEAYDSFIGRFTEPDGELLFATGCATLSAALKTGDPVKQDLLAVSAASQLVSFEMGWGWVDLLYILDFILGLEESPSVESAESFARYRGYFVGGGSFPGGTEESSPCAEPEKRPTKVVYDFGVEVQWFPALVEKFPGRLEEIAEQILDQVAALDTVSVYMHRFSFEGDEVVIATSWNDDLDMLSADADLVAYMDTVGVDGDATPVLVPVPVSEAKTIH